MPHGSTVTADAYAAAHPECTNVDGCEFAGLPQAGLDRCVEEEVPILRMLHRPCPPGLHGFGCDTRWDMHDSFLPKARRWLRQWNTSSAASVQCQRGFFNAFDAVLTRMHWHQEWDAQPFRIAATPPRTMGKMLHQLVTANYYHLTHGASRKPLRSARVPGSHMRALPQPGFRWNVLDYGGGGREPVDYKRLTTMPGNVFSRPLAASKRCASVRGAWHCLWQRFPGQALQRSPTPLSKVGQAAAALYNLSLSGRRTDSLMQYLVVSAVVSVFTQPTPMVHSYLREHLRTLCHRTGPYCGGTVDERRTPIAALHVRQGDSCDRLSDAPGPFNAMFAPNPEHGGKLERTTYRYCYSWKVYRQALAQLQQLYGVRTVVLASDDHTGRVVRSLAADKAFNWVYLDYPRDQFRKTAWMEFRSECVIRRPAPFATALPCAAASLTASVHTPPPPFPLLTQRSAGRNMLSQPRRTRPVQPCC